MLATLVIGLAIALGFILWEWKGAKVPLMPRKEIVSMPLQIIEYLCSLRLQEPSGRRSHDDTGH